MHGARFAALAEIWTIPHNRLPSRQLQMGGSRPRHGMPFAFPAAGFRMPFLPASCAMEIDAAGSSTPQLDAAGDLPP
jgi:hypothetical protein